MYTRPIIVLRNRFGDIVRFTGFHAFAEPYSGRVSTPLTSSSNERLYHVCAMLNYILIDQYEKFGVDHIFFVDWESTNSFLCSYASEPSANGRFRSRAMIERCVNNVADFIRRLKYKYDGEANEINDLLALWLSAFKQPNHAKLDALLSFFEPKYPETCRLYRAFSSDSEIRDKAHTWKLLDCIFANIEKEITACSEDEIETFIKLLDTDSSLASARVFADFMRYVKLSEWDYRFGPRGKPEAENGAYPLSDFAVMAYCVFNDDMQFIFPSDYRGMYRQFFGAEFAAAMGKRQLSAKRRGDKRLP